MLVGTVSVEKSERLAKMLKKKGIKHNVLNAVNHEAEANVIAQAGRFKAVTIATNMAGRGTDILLGGNPEFLARADMENEWIQRSAALPEGGERYEEVLQKLRERYDDAIQQARRKYEPKWKPFEETQAAALDRLSEAHHRYLEAAFWKARATYEQHAAELGGQATDAAALTACSEAATAYSGALQEIDRVAGPFFGDEGQQRFTRALGELHEALNEAARNGGGEAGRLAAARVAFERARADYERAVQKGLSQSDSDGGDYEEAARIYRETEQEFKQAEAAYLEHHKPFEQAVAAAQREYEATRRKYTKAVEDVREEMEKAPLEFRDRYDEILNGYKVLCAEERDKVIAAGGLHIMGTERHESRRIDNQLRGRAGRQGDPGSSRFYLSLEDDLLRIFGAERIQGLMTRLGMEEGVPIEHRLITRAVANAQSKVEGHNFDIRKHLLEYDDVMNQQREIVYARRRDILSRGNLKNDVLEMADDVAAGVVEQYANRETHADEWDWTALSDTLFKSFSLRPTLNADDKERLTVERLETLVVDQIHAAYEERERVFTPPVLRHLEKLVLLQTLDTLWKDHLLSMDHLKEGIGLRGYAQQNPLQEYKKEGFELFEAIMQQFEADVVEKVFTVQIARQEDVERMQERRRPQPMQMVMSGGGAPQPASRKPQTVRHDDKVGRNDPCPCGSGKKYKKCHGA